MRNRVLIPLALVLFSLGASVVEGQQIFTDLPISGQISAFQVNGSYSASNSFKLNSSANVGEVVFGAWVAAGDSVTGVNWAIGTTPYDTSLGSGVASTSSVLDLSNAAGLSVDTVSFAIPGVSLAAGSYYLTLSGAVSASGNPVYWDVNNAAGIDAWSSAYGHVSAANSCYAAIGIAGTCASSFQLLSPGTALTALPSTLAFPSEKVGTSSSSQSVLITNTGATAAIINAVSITGTDPGDFAQTNNCPVTPSTLAALGTCTISVTFTPQAAGARSAAASITGSSAVSVALSGTGTVSPSAVVVSPSSIAFPNQAVNTSGTAQTITVTNSGPSPLTVSSVAVTGANIGDFTQTNNCPPSPATIAVNGTCTISVTFTPQAAGARSAAIAITDNGTGSPQSVSVSGTGTAPIASLTAPAAFASTTVGSTSAALTATLSNTGTAPLNNIVATIGGANPSDFAVTTGANACGATLAAGSSCLIYVTFTPASATAFSATLSVADSGTNSPQTAALTGTGIAPVASLTAPAAFPSTTVGSTSAALAATLSNAGAVPLSNIVATIGGANPNDFAITTGANACGATLAAGSSCLIYVTFTPASATAFSATLSVADSGTNSPQTAALAGTGVASAPAAWPNGYNYQATFTVAAGVAPSAQTNFPALISGTFADLATTANGGRIQNTCTQTVGNNTMSAPCDLIFTSDAAGTQLLSWEFGSWTAATGAVSIWVNVPNLASGTTIYAWYGQASVAALQTTSSATWANNYSAVYHLGENPAGNAPQLNDSTGNGNNATMNGSVLASQQQPGEVGGSINFEGDTWASLTSSSAFNFERTNSFSISGWFKIGSNTVGSLLTKLQQPINGGWGLMQYAGASSPQFALALWGANASTGAYAETPQVSMGVWHYVVATYSGTGNTAGMNIYVDGVNQTLTTMENNLATSILNSSTPAINSRSTDYQNSNDAMDELRVSASGVVLSQTWVTAAYNNQSSPATFFNVATGITEPGGSTVAVSPSSTAFPNQMVNTSGTAQPVTVTNNGPNPLAIGSIAITGTNTGDFTQTNNCPLNPAEIAVNGTCTISVTFTPQAAGARSAAIAITDNGAGSPQSVSVSGTGTAPIASLTAPAAFPGTTVGSTSAALTAALSNTGTAPLNNIVATIGGANPSDFAITTGANACGATLAAGSSCSIYVTFTPASATGFSATLSVADSGTNSPQTAALTGTGVAWPNGYNYQATFTVAAGVAPSAQTNFPALISGTFADFATTANGGRIQNTCTQTVGNNPMSVPCDLIFTSDAAGTQLLSWEFGSWTAGTGAVSVWVNVPNLASGTTIYAWYGQASAAALQTTPSATWANNYSAVYHLGENPAGNAPQLNDSTGNGNNATMNGSVLASQQQPGEVGGSINFEGDTWASLASSSAFNFERTNSFSISGWFMIASNTIGSLLTKISQPMNAGWTLMQYAGASSPQLSLGLWGTNASTGAYVETPQVSMGVWHYVVATYSGTGTTAGMNIYVDGVNQTLTTKQNNLATSILNSSTPAINSRSTDYQNSNDAMDELRVSASGVVLSQAWVTAAYNNQSSPATFFNVTTGITNP